jgi:hypothetical protein
MIVVFVVVVTAWPIGVSIVTIIWEVTLMMFILSRVPGVRRRNSRRTTISISGVSGVWNLS